MKEIKEISEYLAGLSTDLWKSPDAEKLVYGLTHVHPNSARAALEESIKELRGEVTDEDRRWLDTVNASQLIQVLTVRGTGSPESILSASSYLANLGGLADLVKEGGVSGRSLTQTPRLTPEERLEKVIKEMGITFTPEQREIFNRLDEKQAASYLLKLKEHKPFPEPISSGKDLLKKPALKDSQYFHMIDGRDQNHPDHPFNKGYKPFPGFSVPETIEDSLVLPQWFVDKVHAKGGSITMAGIVYEKETEANGERTARENNRQDMLYERYLNTYREMAEHRWTVIEGGDSRGIKQLQDNDPKLLLEAIEKEVYGIMGGTELESLIFRTPELKAKLSENAKRYSNRPMGLLGDIPLYITADVTPACMDKFFFVTHERILPAHF